MSHALILWPQSRARFIEFTLLFQSFFFWIGHCWALFLTKNIISYFYMILSFLNKASKRPSAYSVHISSEPPDIYNAF
jgi:hypothetical protein